MKTIKNIIITFTALASFAPAMAQKYVGGDISMLPYYEQKGATYYNHEGTAYDNALNLFKAEGWNAMRVRLFVNPTKQTTNDKAPYTWKTDNNVCQDIEWVKALGKRIKAAGIQFMLDIHYSDTWADPAKQWTPVAWASLSDDALATKVYDYTVDVLTQLKNAGAEARLRTDWQRDQLWYAVGTAK